MKDIRSSTPRAYYNENDPFAAHWLYNLIQAKLVAAGDIDSRDIRDVRPGDLAGYAQCHFFAGIGGWSYALRLAGVADRHPVWTGSCPCQPFSAAGKRQGFADDRHLWPVWRKLIEERRPAIVFGEQVASAADWLRLVRSDLEALDYAVGAMPVEAASAGADHLRDRYWFVAHGAQQQHGAGHARASGRDEYTNSGVVDTARIGRREGRPKHEIRSGGPAAAGASSAIAVGDPEAFGPGWGQDDKDGGRRQCTSSNSSARSDGMAHADSVERGIGDEQPAGQFPQQQQQHSEACASGDVGDAFGAGAGRHSSSTRPQAEGGCERLVAGSGGDAPFAPNPSADSDAVADSFGERRGNGQRLPAQRGESLSVPAWSDGSSEFSWVIGADNKARRVKPGVRLLVDGFPNRVGLLRGFGNAIDPRPASAFVKSAIEALGDLNAALTIPKT